MGGPHSWVYARETFHIVFRSPCKFQNTTIMHIWILVVQFDLLGSIENRKRGAMRYSELHEVQCDAVLISVVQEGDFWFRAIFGFGPFQPAEVVLENGPEK